MKANYTKGLGHRSGPYEIQAEGEKENPLQKLNRLKCEVAELEEELAKNNVHDYSTLFFLSKLNFSQLNMFVFIDS